MNANRTFNTVRALVLITACLMIHETDMDAADAQDANYDESKIPAYTLPNALKFSDGSPVTTAQQWPKRRLEILQLFKDHVYGAMPDPPPKNQRMEFEVVKEIEVELDIDPHMSVTAVVKARLKEVKLTLGTESDSGKKHVLNLLMFLPADSKTGTPVFLGYNFQGNHTVLNNPHITLPDAVWDRGKSSPADAKARGVKSSRWPVGLIVSRGYGIVTAYYGDVDPDFHDEFNNGVHGLYPDLQDRDDNWTSIGAWAWGLSRVMDYFENASGIDSSRVAIFGHSRLGKTSLWAGATDERFRVVISNNSGCGGAALARREIGETVKRINEVFPHWFCGRHKSYNESVNEMPVDQHMLIGLMAPRAVYIASAEGDRWADPKGEFLSAYHAGPVYQLLGKQGLAIDQAAMPATELPLGESIGYHVRQGKHDIKRYDWEQYLNFVRRHFEQ